MLLATGVVPWDWQATLTSRRFDSAASRGQDDSKEPPPRVAHQQRLNAGAVTTAISMVPATSSAR